MHVLRSMFPLSGELAFSVKVPSANGRIPYRTLSPTHLVHGRPMQASLAGAGPVLVGLRVAQGILVIVLEQENKVLRLSFVAL